MAQKNIVTASQGQVTILLKGVDRQRSRVMFEVPQLNAQLIFTVMGGKPKVFQESDRRPIDPNQSATLHVSRSLYRFMAQWAASIINDRR